jgi:hypothetical protein
MSTLQIIPEKAPSPLDGGAVTVGSSTIPITRFRCIGG